MAPSENTDGLWEIGKKLWLVFRRKKQRNGGERMKKDTTEKPKKMLEN